MNARGDFNVTPSKKHPRTKSTQNSTFVAGEPTDGNPTKKQGLKRGKVGAVLTVYRGCLAGSSPAGFHRRRRRRSTRPTDHRRRRLQTIDRRETGGKLEARESNRQVNNAERKGHLCTANPGAYLSKTNHGQENSPFLFHSFFISCSGDCRLSPGCPIGKLLFAKINAGLPFEISFLCRSVASRSYLWRNYEP